MEIKHITKENFAAEVENASLPVLLDLWAGHVAVEDHRLRDIHLASKLHNVLLCFMLVVELLHINVVYETVSVDDIELGRLLGRRMTGRFSIRKRCG